MNRWSSLLNNYRTVSWKEGPLTFWMLDHVDGPRIRIERGKGYTSWDTVEFSFEDNWTPFGRRFKWWGHSVIGGSCYGIPNIPEDVREILRPILEQLPYRIKADIDENVARGLKHQEHVEAKRQELIETLKQKL